MSQEESMMQASELLIGPGFQEWLDSHQATPVSNELYFSQEMSTLMARVSVGGQDSHVLLFYNKLSNEVVPFVQATL
jgi:hypothetical protein